VRTWSVAPLYSGTAPPGKPFAIGHMYIILLRMTDVVTSQNIDLSSWNTLYNTQEFAYNKGIHFFYFSCVSLITLICGNKLLIIISISYNIIYYVFYLYGSNIILQVFQKRLKALKAYINLLRGYI
jgi:hypothetical protein